MNRKTEIKNHIHHNILPPKTYEWAYNHVNVSRLCFWKIFNNRIKIQISWWVLWQLRNLSENSSAEGFFVLVLKKSIHIKKFWIVLVRLQINLFLFSLHVKKNSETELNENDSYARSLVKEYSSISKYPKLTRCNNPAHTQHFKIFNRLYVDFMPATRQISIFTQLRQQHST